MPNLNTARFSLTGMGAVRALKDRLEDQWVTVTDFGATGNGTTDDTAAIQATLNYAYGPEGAPHGDTNSYLNKRVLFPRGLYKISAPLKCNHVHGLSLIGAGLHQSRIFWAGPPALASIGAGYYPVIECRGCWHTYMEGLTFDASGIQNRVMLVDDFPTWPDDGSDGYYRDIHIKGAVRIGGVGGYGVEMGHYGAMSSERTWVNCKFTDCEDQAYRLLHGNTLNHEFYGCTLANNTIGIFANGQAGSMVISNSYFYNNSARDIRSQCNMTRVQNNHSTSVNFCAVDGFLVGNTHINASAGEFLGNWNDSANPWQSTDTKTSHLTGNHSTNGIVKSDGGPEAGNTGVHLMGNRFDNTGYLADTLSFYTSGGVAWVDGVKRSGAGHS